MPEKRAPGVALDAALAWSAFPRGDEGAEIPTTNDAPNTPPAPRFPVTPELNDIVRVLIADDVLPCELDVEVCVCLVTERLAPVDDAARVAFLNAGPELRAECDEIGACRTGEAKMCDARLLCASKLVCTVGPRYVEKYRTAATNALSHCYRGALECCVEAGKETIAIPVMYTADKHFPREFAAHVAIRTIRRFLENWPGKLTSVVLCLTKRDAEMYVGNGKGNKGLLACYFPRDDAEIKFAGKTLPKDVGNGHGEMDIADRAITIGSFPSSVSRVGSAGENRSGNDVLKADGRRRNETHDSGSILGVTESPEQRRARFARREKQREAGNDDEFDFWFGGGGDDDDAPQSVGGTNGCAPDSPNAKARSNAARHETLVRIAFHRIPDVCFPIQD
jgi:O-acetyl-ADP-ribose deacetylase (regulator of RNase III)